ncbi:MAG: helix-turn-helix domain-containing protein [Puniceicoccales bacterium]|jgi:cytoskeletal protein RodZ|nr:helix-turn-helix domain-containing protein [Puniceicoccales bacterium]
MNTVGEKLMEARQRRGISTQSAAEATHVRCEYLEAIENNHFDLIPLAEVYKRGFLKIYARFLRLDSVRLLEEYAASAQQNRENTGTRRLQFDIGERSNSGGNNSDKISATLDGDEISSTEYPSPITDSSHQSSHRRRWSKGTSFTLIFFITAIIVAVGTWFLLRDRRPKPALPANTTTQPEPRSYQAIINTTDAVTTPVHVTIYKTRTQNGNLVRGQKIFDEPVEPGQKRTISAQGSLWVESKNIKSITVQIGGNLFAISPNTPDGANSFLINELHIIPSTPSRR